MKLRRPPANADRPGKASKPKLKSCAQESDLRDDSRWVEILWSGLQATRLN